jgi:transmembrane sensor
MQQEDFEELLNRNISGKATDFERQLLDAYYDRLSVSESPFTSKEDEEAVKAEILGRVRARMHEGKVVAINKKPWRLFMAAAIFIGLLATGYFWFLQPKWSENNGEMADKGQGNEILPGRAGAILQLANGQSILLDTMQNGTVIVQENLRIVKEEGKIRYEAVQSGNASLASLTNTVSTPTGRKWNLQLPDGSTVWLNSESAITYPLAFNSTERKVQMSGEAYFDIVHDDRMPFRVQAGSMVVEDMGTAFNINAYPDNARQHVTLAEGRAQVNLANAGVSSLIDLKPGQQAEVTGEGTLILNKAVNVEDIISWKNGQFKFSEGTINEVMTAAARWYGITVTYDGPIKEHFVLNLSRDLPLSALLEILESTGSVRFEVSGKQVKVIAVQ